MGPTAEGEIPAESVKTLKELGVWMKTNGEAVYGTSASPFRRLPWGRCTSKLAGTETILYLHVFDWPADGKLIVPGLENTVKSAEILAGGAKLPIAKSPAGLVLTVPPNRPDKISSTIKIVIEGRPVITEPVAIADTEGVIRLLAADAALHGGGLRLERKKDASNIGFWTVPDGWKPVNIRKIELVPVP